MAGRKRVQELYEATKTALIKGQKREATRLFHEYIATKREMNR